VAAPTRVIFQAPTTVRVLSFQGSLEISGPVGQLDEPQVRKRWGGFQRTAGGSADHVLTAAAADVLGLPSEQVEVDGRVEGGQVVAQDVELLLSPLPP